MKPSDRPHSKRPTNPHPTAARSPREAPTAFRLALDKAKQDQKLRRPQ